MLSLLLSRRKVRGHRAPVHGILHPNPHPSQSTHRRHPRAAVSLRNLKSSKRLSDRRQFTRPTIRLSTPHNGRAAAADRWQRDRTADVRSTAMPKCAWHQKALGLGQAHGNSGSKNYRRWRIGHSVSCWMRHHFLITTKDITNDRLMT